MSVKGWIYGCSEGAHAEGLCEAGVRWRQMICCGDPNREQMKEEDFNDTDLSGVVKVLVLL